MTESVTIALAYAIPVLDYSSKHFNYDSVSLAMSLLDKVSTTSDKVYGKLLKTNCHTTLYIINEWLVVIFHETLFQVFRHVRKAYNSLDIMWCM